MSTLEEMVPSWEASKENVLPIKRGRSVKVLTENVAGEKSQSDNNIKIREKIFHDKILNAENSPTELFEVYVSYFKWTRDTFPSNNEKTVKILEVFIATILEYLIQTLSLLACLRPLFNFLQDCTCKFKDQEGLKNDDRFIKMWIEYVTQMLLF